MRDSSVSKKCPCFPHSGPVGCLPAPNIFPLAKETFAKRKMFWNFNSSIAHDELIKYINESCSKNISA